MTWVRAPAVRLRRHRRALETGIFSAGPVVWAVVAVLLLAGSARGAGTVAHGYNEANALYRQGEFRKAAGRYEEVLSQGVRNGNVFSIWAMPGSRPVKSAGPFWPMSGP